MRLETERDWLQRLGLTSNRLIALQRPFGAKYQLDWQLVVVAPEEDFTAQVLQARQWALLAMAAGGDLAGTYPSPTLANNAVESVNITDGAVGTADIADDAITTAKILDGTIVTGDLADNIITQAKIAPGVTLPPGGPAGGDLAGTYPNPTLANNAVESVNITDGAVGTADLAVASVTTDKILDATILTADVADNAITQAKIGPGVTLPPGGPAGGDLTGTYPNPTLANNAVESINITDGTVGTADLADDAVTSTKILDGAILTADIADNAIPSKIFRPKC